jgi:hypothetical protein
MWPVARLTCLLLLSLPFETKAWIIGKPLFGESHVCASWATSKRLRVSNKENHDDAGPQATNLPPSTRRRIQRPIRHQSSAAAQELQERARKAQERHEEALKDPTLLTDTQFADVVPELAPTTVRALTEILGLQRMTEIQAKTYPAAVAGKSILGRARTGTGKVRGSI